MTATMDDVKKELDFTEVLLRMPYKMLFLNYVKFQNIKKMCSIVHMNCCYALL